MIAAINQLPERQRFMKGIFSWVGFNSTHIEYERQERSAGQTKFSGWKLWNLALEGITSFSTLPLRLWSYCGFVISFIAFIYAIVIVFKTLALGIKLPGYASIVTIMLFLGGIQLISIGIIGEYIGRIYMEVKQRPIYIANKVYSKSNEATPLTTHDHITQRASSIHASN